MPKLQDQPVVEETVTPVDLHEEPTVKFPVTAREAARLLREDPRFTGTKLTDKAVRRLVREHDIAGMDDDKYTRHLYDAETFAAIAETYFAPADRRAAQDEAKPEADAPDAA
jgi:hypothetical protein